MPQLITVRISGNAEAQGSTGEVWRLSGRGRSQSLPVPGATQGFAGSLQEAVCELIVTFTGTKSFQEISWLGIGAELPLAQYASLGSGYLIDSPRGRRFTGVSVGGHIASPGTPEARQVVFSWFEIDRVEQTFALTAVLAIRHPDEETE